MVNNNCGEASFDEIERFFKSLSAEKKTFKLPLDKVVNSKILLCKMHQKEILGIAGVRMHKMLPVLFIIVKSENQGHCIGSDLLRRLHEMAQGSYGLLFLSVMNENESAINLFLNFDYRIFASKDGRYYMVRFLEKSALRSILKSVFSIFRYHIH